MNDWQVGDLACCINDEGWVTVDEFYELQLTHKRGPVMGQILIVRGTKIFEDEIYLTFDHWADDDYVSYAFKKVPPIKETEEDKDAIAHMRGDRVTIRVKVNPDLFEPQ